MRVTELETLLADYKDAGDIQCFKIRPSVETLQGGENGDIRMTTEDNHYHLYKNGWIDLGSLEDERLDKVDQVIEDLEDGNFITKDEAEEVIVDLTGQIFVPMSDEDIDNLLNGGA